MRRLDGLLCRLDREGRISSGTVGVVGGVENMSVSGEKRPGIIVSLMWSAEANARGYRSIDYWGNRTRWTKYKYVMSSVFPRQRGKERKAI